MFESAMIAMPEVPVARPVAENVRLEQMFATHCAAIWRILRRRGLSSDAAADATQETFTIAVERLHEIQADNERSFLIRTALRVARTLGRRNQRWQLEDDMDQRGLEGRGADQRRADIQLCDLALSKVAPDLAEVFVLFELEELSSPEIASLLEIPLGTVASRLRRARKDFRNVFARLERTMHREEQP
jgi:RNA polymerase sigma-70 factor (ECF subfamily)